MNYHCYIEALAFTLAKIFGIIQLKLDNRTIRCLSGGTIAKAHIQEGVKEHESSKVWTCRQAYAKCISAG